MDSSRFHSSLTSLWGSMGVRDWASQMTRLLQADHSGPRVKDGGDPRLSVPNLAAHARLSDMATVALVDSAETVEVLNRSSMAHFVAGLVVGLEDMAAPTEHHAEALAAHRTVVDDRYHWGACRDT